MRKNILPLLVTALACLVGCAPRAAIRATCPAEGGHSWREVRGPHFRVYTDLGTRVARLTALELEQLRSALLLAWGGQADPPATVEVIAVRSEEALEEFTEGVPLEAFLDSSGSTPLMVMSGNGEYLVEKPESRQVQAHELAHHLSRFVLPRQPRWLAEGLATSLQTVRFTSLRTKATFDRFHREYHAYLTYHGRLPLEDLWLWEERTYLSTGEALPYYASAWLWVVYLMDEHPERFRDFWELLARAEEPRRAWEAAFGSAQGLEEGFARYEPERKASLTVALPPMPEGFTLRELDCAEIHALRGRLFLRSPGHRSPAERVRLATREVEAALRENPTSESALLLQARLSLEPAERLARARALVKAHPESGAGWSLLGRTLQETEAPVAEQEQALRRAVERAPEDVEALVALAWLHAGKVEPQQGLAAAERAVRLAPGRASAHEAHAALLFQAGRCEESVAAQQRALNVLEGQVTAPLREAAESTREVLQERLAEYQRRCANKAGP